MTVTNHNVTFNLDNNEVIGLEIIRLNVMKSIQKDQIIYMGYLTPEQARIITFTDEYPPGENRLGYQRPPEKKRINNFSKYLENETSSFVTPILLNSRQEIKFHVIDSDYGYIDLPKKACLAIVDGQHRTLGTILFDKIDIPIPFMLFDHLDVSLEQELFVTINREQKKVSMSHVRFIDREKDPLSKIVIKLEHDPESPWYQKVNLVGLRGTKRPVSLDSLSSALKELLQSGEVKMLSLEQQYMIARDFWEVVAKVWPEAWEASKNSLLRKSMGTLAVSKLGGYLLPLCLDRTEDITLDKDKLFDYLLKAKNVNWMNNGDFKGFSGRQGADLVKNALDTIIFSGE